ncbi:MAG: hypothetical protein NTY63_04115 [Candidatus Bipolaricaulota bacterium]|nr:hypothetical protein [Candidatus Bipolaricaulota bacterium]
MFCYDCHEELLHNPVLLKQDIFELAELVKRRGLAEDEKTESRDKAARRVEPLHEVIVRGLGAILAEERGG